MATFGIIAEGITDQLIIKNILTGYLKDAGEEPFFTPVQPREAPPGSDPPPAGWTLVFKSIEAGDHRKALQFNDYVVIQIDTDVSQEKGFDVSWHDGGRELTVEELIDRVTVRLRDAPASRSSSRGSMSGRSAHRRRGICHRKGDPR